MSNRETPSSPENPSHSEENLSEMLDYLEIEILRIVNSLSLKAEQGSMLITATDIAAADLPFLAVQLSNLSLHPNRQRPLDVPASYVEFRGQSGKAHRLAVAIVEEEFGLKVFDDDLFQQYEDVFGPDSSQC